MTTTKIDIIKIYKHKSALVIDDYPDMRGSIRRMLENFGVFKVDTASNGEEAITKCEEYSYDIILADYNLGDNKNGQQILEELRFKHLLKSTSLYMMITAETTKNMVFGALEYQPDDYLTKPFTQSVLAKRLDRMVMEKEALYDINNAIDQLDFDKAILLCQQRIQLHDRYETRCHKIMGSCFLQKHQYQQSKKVYQDILAERPLEWASIGLGKSLIALNELEEAESVFQQLVDDGCLCLEIYDCLADIKVRKDDIDSAQAVLKQAIDISPNAIMRQEKLAGLCEDNQDWQQAEKSRKKVIKLGRNSVYETPEHHFQLARCLSSEMANSQAQSAHRLKDAQEVLRKVKRKYPNHENIVLQSDIIEANIYADAGKKEKSIECIDNLQEKLATATNKSPQLMLDMAKTFKAVGEHQQANNILQDLASEYAENPEISEAVDRLSDEPLSQLGKQKAVQLNNQGKELLAAKEFGKAIDLFGQALKHYPNNIGLNLNLMLALVKQMTTNGASQKQLDRCKRAEEKIAHISSSNPLHERYKVLCEHSKRLQASI